MELFINETAIGVSPQESDTIQDLLNAILKELEENLIIASMVIDGTYCSIDDPKILGTSVSQVHKIELTVTTTLEISISLLEDGKQFVILGAQELKNGSLAKKNELINSFAWIIESLEALQGSLAFPPADISILRAILKQIITRLDENNVSLDETKELGEHLEKIVNVFDLLQHKISNEKDYSKESTHSLLKEIQPKLPDIATNFQTGNDLQAIQDLCKIVDVIETFTRFSALNSTDNDIEQHSLALKDISLQMLNAFENKDFVLIADLLEYDLSEQIDNILEN